MIFMGVMLEKWPNKGQEYLKYIFNVRLAASRGSGTGWAAYDEQYRLRKARYPHTPWGDIYMELWVLHVSTPAKYAHFDNTNVSQKLESKNEPFLADFKRGKTPQSHMYVGNCCDFWLCDCQLTTLYGKVAAKLRVSCELSDRL
jgi:hypothetical protein